MATPPALETRAPRPVSRRMSWLRRLGAAGFLFFLVKGLLWLLIPAALLAWQALTH
ncbi:MAG: hypothetical protein R2991_07580 [Thermoanaerobaculia bacterium]